MRNQYIIIGIVLELLLMSLSWLLGYNYGKHTYEVKARKTDTIMVVDTITYAKPIMKDSLVVRYVTEKLPLKHNTNDLTSSRDDTPSQESSDESDSVAVEIPIVQKEYRDSTYHAWISGYKPQLDSIKVYQRTTEITRKEIVKSKSRINIGLIGGYGYGLNSKQTEPFIGLGVSYSIISF